MKQTTLTFITILTLSTYAFAGILESDKEKAEKCYQKGIKGLTKSQLSRFKRDGEIIVKEMKGFNGEKYLRVIVPIVVEPYTSLNGGFRPQPAINKWKQAESIRFDLESKLCKE